MDRHAWNERYREKELLWTAQPNRFLLEAVTGLEPGKAYDLAGGEGRNAVWLAEHGWLGTGGGWSGGALGEGGGVPADPAPGAARRLAHRRRRPGARGHPGDHRS